MIYVVVALAAEARPLVAHLGLQRVPELEPLIAYRRPDLVLVVSGVGKSAAAAAVDILAEAVPPERHSAWINIGVAGHRSHAVGTVALADSVEDREGNRRWSLTVPQDLNLMMATVWTVVQVETEFEGDALYDMEAAGFCQRATRLTVPGLVQVVKIVSDNRETGTLCVSARQVQSLVQSSLPEIDRLFSSLHRSARRSAAGQSSDQSPSDQADSVSWKNSPKGTRPS